VPAKVKLDLTYRCNLRCVHCCIVPEDRPELTLEEICLLLDQLVSKGCLYLLLSGGEIFLRPDLPEILECSRSKGFSLRLFTNGTMVPDALIPRLRDFRVGEVDISLYGDTAEVHDGVTRVPGSFDRAMHTIRHLGSTGILTKISFMLLRQNVSRLRRMIALGESLGAAFTVDEAVFPKLDGSPGPLDFRVPPKDLEDLIVYRESCAPDLRRMKESWDRDRWLDEPACGAGIMTCSISPYGDVTPCPVMPLTAGNIREQSFGDIWDHSDVMHRVRSLRRRDLKSCASCELAPFCILCPGRALLEDGDLTGPWRFRCDEAALHSAVYEKIYGKSGPCNTPRK
jgi:radical SAM protein with 4Fe4S-binding SPASM domain